MDQETYKALSSLLTEINTSSTSGVHHVLHFPIISMRSYQTDLYDLTCDGNFNRLVSVWINLIDTYLENLKSLEDSAYIWQRNNFHITVVLPSREKLTKNSIGYIKKALDLGQGFLDFYMTDSFPSGGPKQERSFLGSLGLSKELLHFFKDYKPSVVVYEAEYLGLFCEYIRHLDLESSFKTVFWCPVSSTLDEDPPFLANVKHVDLELAIACDVLMVATQRQADYFKTYEDSIQYKTILNPMLIDPSLEIFSFNADLKTSELIGKYLMKGYKIVYFPFRMTDPGYQFDRVMSALIALTTGFGNKILLLYSDPNDSKKAEAYRGIKEVQNGNLLLERVPSARDTYYTIISNQRVVVPYLENIDNIMHASWQEMQYYKTNIVREPLFDAFLQAFGDASRNVNKMAI